MVTGCGNVLSLKLNLKYNSAQIKILRAVDTTKDDNVISCKSTTTESLSSGRRYTFL